MRTLIASLVTNWDRDRVLTLIVGPPTPTNVLAGILIGSLIVIAVRAPGF